jgi:protein O-mannosyl-transferase
MTGVLLAISAVLLFAWRGSLQGGFQFDDHGNIVQNRAIRSLWPLDPFLTNNRPLGLFSFALNYRFGALDPRGYHLVNLAIHVSNALLLTVGVLLARCHWSPRRWPIGGDLSFAAGCGLLWGVHPITTQAVTYLVQRYESLSTLGYLGAWVFMILVARGCRWACVFVGVFAWVGLLSKEIMATAPLVILLFDRLFLASSWSEILRRRWLAYFLLVSPVLWFLPSVSRWFDPGMNGSMGLGLKTVTPWQYLRTQPEVLLRYVKLTLWPSDLTFDYAWKVQNRPEVYIPLGGLVVAALGLGVWLYRGHRPLGFLILAFFLILAPTSSVMPIADLAVEHRMYLPSAVMVVGCAAVLSALFDSAAPRLPFRSAMMRPVVVTSYLALVVAAAWRTELRNRDYRDAIVLWSRNIETRPQNPRAHYMLGAEWLARGEFERAFEQFQIARDRWFGGPGSALVFIGLGDCLREFGRFREAEAAYRQAIQFKTGQGEAHNGLGVVLHRQGRLEDARAEYKAATELGLPEARYNLAVVSLELGREADAVSLLERAIAEHPQFQAAARRLAWLLATSMNSSVRNGPRALELVSRHCRPDESQSPLVWDTLGVAAAEAGDFARATAAAERAAHLAAAAGKTELADQIRQRRALYAAGQAYRESPVVTRPPDARGPSSLTEAW